MVAGFESKTAGETWYVFTSMVPPLRLFGLVLCATALLGACKEKQPEDAEVSLPTAEVRPSAPPRVAPFAGAKLGPQPGYIDGGMVYAAVRVGAVQTFLQSLPLPPSAASGLGQLGAAVGLDLRVDDLRARFGLADDVIISMTLGRPLGSEIASISADLEHGGAFIDALVYEPPDPPAPPQVDISYRALEEPPSAPLREREPEDVPEVKQLGDDPIDAPEPPPRPSVEAIAKAEDFRRRASQLGTHIRIHIPTVDPARIVTELEALSSRRMLTRWDALCRAIPTATRCIGESDFVMIARPGKAGLDLDILVFGVPQSADERGQIAAAREAALAKTTTKAHLSELEGDAAVHLDADGVHQMARMDGLARAIRRLGWTSAEADRRAAIDRQLEGVKSVDQLADAKLLFGGVSAELSTTPAGLAARVRWHIASGQESTAESLLSGPELVTEVPTLAALCAGALVCARTRGLPAPAPLRDELATGIYAARQRDLERTVQRGDAWADMFLLAAAWPNALGAVAHWPSQEIGGGPESLIAANVVDALGRIEGFGGSLRSLSIARRSLHGDYVAYARLRGSELDLVRTGLTFADTPTSQTELAGIEGTATLARLPNAEFAANVLLYTDATDPPGSARFGWAAVADGPDRMAWLLGLEREANTSPTAALEVPDLWTLVSASPEAATELSFAKTWLSGREFRALLWFQDGAPTVEMLLGRAAAAPASTG